MREDKMSDRPNRILLVEDNPGDARLLREALREVASYQFDLEHVERLSQALECLRAEPFDVVLLDLSLPDSQGLDNLATVRDAAPGVPILVLTGLDDEEVAVRALRVGAQDYLVKGQAEGSSVVRAIRYARERKGAEEQIQGHLKRISALRDINLAITSTLDLRTILDVLLEKIDLSFNYAVATNVRLFNSRTGFLEPVACRNLDPDEWKAEEWKSGGAIPKIVFDSQAPITIANVQIEPRTKSHEIFRKQGLFSYLGIPLIAKGKSLGVLEFFSKEEHRFGDQEISFLSTLADQTAIAIQNSQLHEEMKQQAQALEKSNKVKDEFLSVMSHELRSPLIAIMGYANLLEDQPSTNLSPVELKAARGIKKLSNDLLAMIRVILDVTKLETSAMAVEKQMVDIKRLLQEILESNPVPMGKEEVAVRWDYDPHLPEILTDGNKLKIVLQNLISNAIKFTNQGYVKVSARRLPYKKCVEFKVADTGIGIPADMVPIVFEKFRQADSTDARPYEGIGLGLYIVKQFIELLGGSVEVETEVGKGSSFMLIVPDLSESVSDDSQARPAKPNDHSLQDLTLKKISNWQVI
jgi:signal transduction histidine kinase/DNA-binding NarL/FixJ family response regulator